MIYVLSFTPSLDRTVTCDRFDPGMTNRVRPLREDLGGKGVNCALTLLSLGGEVTLCGADYEGRVRRELEEKLPLLLTESGLPLRCNLKIFDRAEKRTVEVNELSPALPAEVTDRIRNGLLALLKKGDILVLCGSLPEGAPAGTYRDLCVSAKEKGAAAVADCSGDALARAVTAGPDLIKPNRSEFEALTRSLGLPLPGRDRESLSLAAKELCEKTGTGRVLLSLGKDGALLATRESVLFCAAPDVTVRGDIGAGDAMTAAAALCLSRGEDGSVLLRTASAAAGAVLEKEGTRPPEPGDILRILKKM